MDKIKEYLMKEYGNKCSICGQEFNENILPVIDYIIPKCKGGIDNISNLQLTCFYCNAMKQGKFVSTIVFEKCIELIIKSSKKYSLETIPRVYNSDLDLVLKNNLNNEYNVCEVKANDSFTTNRIKDIIKKLNISAENLKRQYGNIRVRNILIFPGKLSQRNEHYIKLNHIEVWDRDYLIANFNDEILKLDNSYLNSILRMFKDNYEHKSDDETEECKQKINELRECESGIKNWGQYQKLVGEIIELLFFPNLSMPIYQSYDQRRINRRDFIMPNYDMNGFWCFIRQRYNAEYIVIDAKNSTNGVTKQDILQIANYLKINRNRIIWHYYYKKI